MILRRAGKFPTLTPFQETLDMKRQRSVIAQQDMTKCLPSGCQVSNYVKRLHLHQFFCFKAYLKVKFSFSHFSKWLFNKRRIKLRQRHKKHVCAFGAGLFIFTFINVIFITDNPTVFFTSGRWPTWRTMSSMQVEQFLLDLHTGRPLTESDYTRCCINWPPDDKHVFARNM